MMLTVFPYRVGLCVVVLLLALNGATLPSHGAVDSRCYSDWSEAGPVARMEGLVPVSRILEAVRADQGGRVARVQLCRGADTFYYRVAVFASGGTLSWLQVNARTGRIEPLVRP